VWMYWSRYCKARTTGRQIVTYMLTHWQTLKLKHGFGIWIRAVLRDIAATTIQSFARMLPSRMTIWRSRERIRCVCLVQPLVRGWLARIEHEHYLSDRVIASCVIQKWIRSRLLAYRTKLRIYRALKREWDLEHENASVVIQAFYRMYKAQRRAIEIREYKLWQRRETRKRQMEVARMLEGLR